MLLLGVPVEAVLIVIAPVTAALLLIGLELYGIRRERLHAERNRPTLTVLEGLGDDTFENVTWLWPERVRRDRDLAGEAMESDGLGAG